MKKTKIFFLALLCLIGSDIYAQKVAHPDPYLQGPPGPDVSLPGATGENKSMHGFPKDSPDNITTIPSNGIVLYGEIESQHPIDSILLVFWEKILGKSINRPERHSRFIQVKPGNLMSGSMTSFVFTAMLSLEEEYAYLTLADKSEFYEYLDKYLVQRGDTIRVSIDLGRGKMVFGGNNHLKYESQYQVRLAAKKRNFTNSPIFFTQDKNSFLAMGDNADLYQEAIGGKALSGKILRIVERGEQEWDFIEHTMEERPEDDPRYLTLMNYEGKIPEGFYQILKGNLIGGFYLDKINGFNRGYIYDNDRRAAVFEKYIKPLRQDHISSDRQYYAYLYREYLFHLYISHANVLKSPMYRVIDEAQEGVLKEMLWSYYILMYYRQLKEGTRELEKILASVSTPWIQEPLAELFYSQTEGTDAFPFSLKNDKGEWVHLKDFSDKLVFIDFWFTGCFACVKFYENTLRQVEHHFKDNPEAVFVSVSTDKDPQRWKKSLEGGKYSSPQMVNLNTEGTGHELIKHYNVLSYPRQLLIGKDGKVIKAGGLQLEADELIQILEKSLTK